MEPFTYHGRPVTPQEIADIIAVRRAEWHRNRLGRERDRDERSSGLLTQLWAMIRGRA